MIEFPDLEGLDLGDVQRILEQYTCHLGLQLQTMDVNFDSLPIESALQGIHAAAPTRHETLGLDDIATIPIAVSVREYILPHKSLLNIDIPAGNHILLARNNLHLTAYAFSESYLPELIAHTLNGATHAVVLRPHSKDGFAADKVHWDAPSGGRYSTRNVIWKSLEHAALDPSIALSMHTGEIGPHIDEEGMLYHLKYKSDTPNNVTFYTGEHNVSLPSSHQHFNLKPLRKD